MTAVCWACGRRVRTYTPKAGDGSVDVFSLHRGKDGKVCHGSKDVVDPKENQQR
jgi:hypothetical protein